MFWCFVWISFQGVLFSVEFCWMKKIRWISHFFTGFILVCIGQCLFTVHFNISRYEIDSQIGEYRVNESVIVSN